MIIKKIKFKEYYIDSNNKVLEYYEDMMIDWIGVVDDYVYVFLKKKAIGYKINISKAIIKRGKIILNDKNFSLEIPKKQLSNRAKVKINPLTVNAIKIIQEYFVI